METIKWSKKYQEDLGTKDSEGFYDYAYCYYTYWFLLPDDTKIRGRQYADTPGKCSLYISLDDLEGKNDMKTIKKLDYVSAIINFLRTYHEAVQFNYFNGTYNVIDSNKIKNNLENFSFEEVTEKTS